VLADGNTVLFTIWYGALDRSEIGAASLDDAKVVPLGILGVKAFGVVDGRILYARADGTLMAAPFDVAHRRVTGTAVPVVDSLRMWDGSGGDVFAFVSHAGGLVYAHGSTNRRLVWVDRSGKARPALDELREYRHVRLSPDGRRVALSIGTSARSDLWVFDIASGTLTPLTTAGRTRNPAWSPDGRRLLYVSTQSGRAAFWWQAANGGGAAVPAGEARHNPWNIDLAPNGKSVVFNAIYDGTFNLESFAIDSTREERDLAASPTAIETFGRFSPDGGSVAYQSDESGRMEVYVRPFPASGARVQISTSGGRRGVWSSDGGQIYYWEGSRLMSASVVRDPDLRVVARTPLFDGRYEVDFDVSNDGTHFLMIESETSGLGVVVVPDWLTELRRATAPGTP
jgi:dipeptidyl aminopeptidase/acylaminoacyl peptidase